MAAAKLVVMYPAPKDVQTFERIYQEEHVPMAAKKLAGKTKLVATKVQGSPQGPPPFHRIVEVHFPSRGAAGVFGFGRREGNARACSDNFQWRSASRIDRRGAKRGLDQCCVGRFCAFRVSLCRRGTIGPVGWR